MSNKIRKIFIGTINEQTNYNCSECKAKCLKCGQQNKNLMLANRTIFKKKNSRSQIIGYYTYLSNDV